MKAVSPKTKGTSVSLSPDLLKNERERLRTLLREIEVQQREAEAALKAVRQRELRIKREIEALTTLIDLADGEHQGAASESTSGQ
jgi:hypothetical protein